MKNKNLIVISIFSIITFLFAWRNTEKKEPQKIAESYIETTHSESKNEIDEVKIGTQTWSAKNLDVNTFNNGDPIPEVKTREEWGKGMINKKPSWCYQKNNIKNGKKYGKLYNWYAVSDPRGLAPKGWHIPSDIEWKTLIDYLGDFRPGIQGQWLAGSKMKSTSGWPNNTNSDNESNFAGLPGGCRYAGYEGSDEMDFGNIGLFGYWWAVTEKDYMNAWACILAFDNEGIVWVENTAELKANGYSVRCVKD